MRQAVNMRALLLIMISMVSGSYAQLTNAPIASTSAPANTVDFAGASTNWWGVSNLGTETTADSSDRRAPKLAPPSRDIAHQVLRDVEVPDTAEATVVAWTPALDGVIVQTRSATNYLVVIAYYEGSGSSGHWRVPCVQYRIIEDGQAYCRWLFGKEEFNHPPTRLDVDSLLKRAYMLSRLPEFVFCDRLK